MTVEEMKLEKQRADTRGIISKLAKLVFFPERQRRRRARLSEAKREQELEAGRGKILKTHIIRSFI